MGRRGLPTGRWFALLLAAGVTAGCAAPSPVVTGDGADPGPLLAGAPLTGLVGRVMVLEDASHGPRMCLGMILTSDPPQCGDVDIEGWDWAAVPRDGYTEKGATRYGDFELSGSLRTFDGPFVLDAPPVPVERTTGGSLSSPDEDLATPCPEPAGGWRPPDPERATDSALSDVALLGEQDPEVGAVWIDQRLPPEVWDWPPEELERVANDPMRLVLNVSSTGDLTVLEARVRELWGGALCMSRAEFSSTQQRQTERELDAEAGVIGAWAHDVTGEIRVDVLTAPADLQERLDARYGVGRASWVAFFIPAAG